MDCYQRDEIKRDACRAYIEANVDDLTPAVIMET